MDDLKKLPIVEVFTSIQGEGDFVGTPSVFVRVSGCNLRCCFKDTICDTPYTSFRPEKKTCGLEDVVKEFEQHPKVEHLVITGGEPMLYKTGVDLLVDEIKIRFPERSIYVTMETNGTVEPDPFTRVDFFSISPKLKTALPVPGKVYRCPDGSTQVFDADEVHRLDLIRFNPKAIEEMIHLRLFQLKFVYSGPESVQDIDHCLNTLKDRGVLVIPQDVWIMPEGITNELLTRNAQEAAKVCIDRGWILCDRLHIHIWGDKRGV